MATLITLLLLAAFVGAPGLLLGMAVGRKLARFGAPPALALVAGAIVGLACGAVLALMIIHDVQSSSDANASIALILLPLPFATNLVTGTLAAFVAGMVDASPIARAEPDYLMDSVNRTPTT